MKRFLLILALLLALPAELRAACVWNATGASAEDTDGGTIALGAPASPLTDDIWIAITSHADSADVTFTDWTVISQTDTGFANVRMGLWYFRYAGSTPNLNVTGSTDDIVGVIIQLRGCDTVGSPVDTLGTQTHTANSNTVTLATITPSTSNTLLLAAIASSGNQSVTTPPTDMTCVTAVNVSAASVSICYKAHVSGATGGLTAVWSSSGDDDENTGRLLAIAEAVVTGGTKSLLTGAGK